MTPRMTTAHSAQPCGARTREPEPEPELGGDGCRGGSAGHDPDDTGLKNPPTGATSMVVGTSPATVNS